MAIKNVLGIRGIQIKYNRDVWVSRYLLIVKLDNLVQISGGQATCEHQRIQNHNNNYMACWHKHKMYLLSGLASPGAQPYKF